MTSESTAQTTANSSSDDEKRYPVPHGLYQQLFNIWSDVRDPENGDTVSPAELKELWRRWFETMAGTETAREENVFVDAIAPLRAEMVEDISQKMLSGDSLPEDPLRFFLQWYNDTNERWSKAADELLHQEEVLKSTSQFFETHARSYEEFRHTTEESLNNLHIPTCSDISRVASLVVVVENKVDRIEEAFEEFIYGGSEPATARAVGNLEERMSRLEDKMDRILAALEKNGVGMEQENLLETSRKHTTKQATDEAAPAGYA